MATAFKCLLSIVEKEGAGSVYHKQDGERFGQKNTVKLNVNTVYDVKITFRPALHLERVLVQGEKAEVEPVISKDCDDDSRIYIIEYDTSVYDVSKRAKRKEVPFVFEFQEGVYMKMSLQCKFYPASETDHCHWGQALSTIELDCKRQEGQSYVIVDRQKYL